MATKTIKVTRMCNLYVNHVPCGIMAFVKTHDNEVRQAKLVRIVWECSYPTFEWKVAGVPELQRTKVNDGPACIPVGGIYLTEFDAQHGKSKPSSCAAGVPKYSHEFNIYAALQETYGAFSTEIIHFSGTFNDFLNIRPYRVLKDGSLDTWTDAEISLEIDEEGVHVRIPAVDEGKMFLTREAAWASYKPKKTITFDDVQEEEPEEERDAEVEDLAERYNALTCAQKDEFLRMTGNE